MKPQKSKFSSEAMLCLTFIRNLPEGWTAYSETGGFDILLSRDADGVQIGIEAKLTLNAKVISQIVEPGSHYRACDASPDFRAVLIPYGCTGSMAGICRLLSITVIEMKDKATWEEASRWNRRASKFQPDLPKLGDDHWYGSRDDWTDWAPVKRITLPDYVPDVPAGSSAPVKLTPWKIKAIKMAVLVEKQGSVSREDFKALQLNHRLWMDPYTGWLTRTETRGVYVAGPKLSSFRAQHPQNYEQIEADFEKWKPKK